jgi:preprotein translocase SecE subunit
MAVAVKNTPEAAPGRQLNTLAVGSLVGTLFVLGSLAVIFFLVPTVWGQFVANVIPGMEGTFGDYTLLLLLMVAAVVGVVYLGRWLIGEHPPHGVRAGVFIGVVGVLAIGLSIHWIGAMLENSWGVSQASVGVPIVVVLAVALLVGGMTAYFRPRFDSFLVRFEDQGWFTSAAYKRTQGQRVRRGTILGILVLAGCGIYTLLSRGTLKAGASHWEIGLPYSGGMTMRLLPDLQFTVPILLAAGTLWLAYRVVNFPPFADFLIATEAELNKVSWTTRKRLVQDTIVVLTTVLLVTAFLFLVDYVWFKVLTNDWIQVLQTNAVSTKKQGNVDEW